MFQIDADLSSLESGVWEEYQGSKFLIAHISNSRFQRALAKYQLPHRRKIAEGTLDPEKNKEIVARAMAEGVLLGWDHVIDAQKQEVKYTPQLAYQVLMRDPEFRDFISEYAMAMTNFKAAEVDEMGKP